MDTKRALWVIYLFTTVSMSLALWLWVAPRTTLALRLSSPTAPDACSALGFGQSISETIAVASEVDCFTFTGSTNDQILARVIKTTGALGPVLEMFAPNGTQVCGTIHSDLACALKADGQHKVSIKDFSGPNTGGYRIYMQRLNAPLGCTSLTFGAIPASGMIELAADVGCFTFAGAAAEQVRVRVVKIVGDLGAVIEIFRPIGTKLCGTIHQELTCQLDATGSHTVLVKDFGGPHTGAFRIHIQRLNGAVNCTPLSFDGAPLSASIDAPSEMDCFPFQGANGASVRARVVKTAGNLGPVIEIARPDGTILCGTIHAELTCQLDADGLHTVLVKDFGGPNTGTYQISLQCLSATCIPEPGCTPPTIEFTFVPAYNSHDLLQGRVTCVNPAAYKVAVYIYPQNWWTKPYLDSPTTSISDNGSWITDITTDGIDECATQIAAFLLPKDYNPPGVQGATKLPEELYQRAVAHVLVMRPYPRAIQFSGYTWYVKTCAGALGPDQNLFSDRSEDVYVDASGQLHLRIAQRNGNWYATEVIGADSLGYGTYVFTFASRVEQLDKNVVLGAFTWNDKVPDYNHRELDIEFSRWGEDAAPNAQFVVQPFPPPEHRYRFDLALTGDQSTHRLTWQPGSAHFASFQGASQNVSNLMASWTHLHDDIPPAGGENPRINLWLFGHVPPSDGQEVEVIVEAFTFTPLPTIATVRPNQGRGDVTNEINLYGTNFAPGAQISLGSAPLSTTFVYSTHLQAIVPVGLASGVYTITVTNPDGGHATLPQGYLVSDPVHNEDLFGLDYELWLDPAAPHAGDGTKLYLVVHRQGGKSPISDVKVSFYQGDPDHGGTLIGEGGIPLLSPRGSATTSTVQWTPAAEGNYAIYAVIDPTNAVSESYEGNNRVHRTLAVLPAATDETPPHVDSFTINDGAASTTERTVRLNTVASDEPATGRVAKLFFVEYSYSEATGQWIPVQQSTWLDYATARTNFTWQLLPTGGIKVLHAWAADAAGNIALFPYRQLINYLPPGQHVAFNQRQLYRYPLTAGQMLVTRLEPISGDPDLYIWPPDEETRPPWVSNLNTGIDDVTLTVPVSGVYQIEVYGFSTATYHLTVDVTTRAAAAQISGGEDPAKVRLNQPLLSITDQPPVRFGLPLPQATQSPLISRFIFLPVIQRDSAAR